MPGCEIQLNSTVRRWIHFNLVGMTGVGVQLSVLSALRLCGVHYLGATALAVEAAVLNNFTWHERWTWLDRADGGRAGTISRLIRFNLTVGLVSIAQNLIFMSILAGHFAIHYLAASVMSITACSVMNFFFSDRLVFKKAVTGLLTEPGSTMEESVMPPSVVLWKYIRTYLVVCAVAGSLTTLHAQGLRPETLEAWSEYVDLTERRIEGELNSESGFFAQDFEDPTQARTDRRTVVSGRLVVSKAKTARADGSDIKVRGGMIHHWRGSVFIPGVTLEVVLDAVRRPDAPEHLQEDVLEAQVLERTDDSIRVYLKLVRSKIVTVTYNTEHVVLYNRHGPGRASSRTIATKIAELADVGTPSEREKPEGSDRGFLWRLNSYWRYQEVSGGVLVECESLTLSRSIPAILKLFVRPIISGVARESLDRTLSSMRERLSNAGTDEGNPAVDERESVGN